MTPLAPYIVVDTSVAAKWYLHLEPDAVQARMLREQHILEQTTLCAPELLLWELANVFRYKRELTPSKTASLVQSTINLDIALYGASPSLVISAVVIACESGITVYDAAFVALAFELKCPLVTADRRLVEKINSPDVRLLASL